MIVRIAVIVSRFNEAITDGLLVGARQALAEASVNDGDVRVVRVPGAFELPVTAMRLAGSGEFDAVVALGCLIKGDTMHFEYIAEATSRGLMDVSLATGVPVAFGVLTTLTEEQAVLRSVAGPENKGFEAARAAIEMVQTLATLPDVPHVHLEEGGEP